MAFMMPVMKNDWDIYNSQRSRRTSRTSRRRAAAACGRFPSRGPRGRRCRRAVPPRWVRTGRRRPCARSPTAARRRPALRSAPTPTAPARARLVRRRARATLTSSTAGWWRSCGGRSGARRRGTRAAPELTRACVQGASGVPGAPVTLRRLRALPVTARRPASAATRSVICTSRTLELSNVWMCY